MTFDPVTELRDLLIRLDADITAGRFSRGGRGGVVGPVLDRLYATMVELEAFLDRLDADIAAGRLSREEGVELAELMLAGLDQLVAEHYPRRGRLQ